MKDSIAVSAFTGDERIDSVHFLNQLWIASQKWVWVQESFVLIGIYVANSSLEAILLLLRRN